MSLDRLEIEVVRSLPKGLKFDLNEFGLKASRVMPGVDASDLDLPKVMVVTEQPPSGDQAIPKEVPQPEAKAESKAESKEVSALGPTGKLWYKVQYSETVRQVNGSAITDRTYAQTPFGKDVHVQLKDGKIVAVTDKDGKRIPGVEVTPEGEIVFVQNGTRVKFNEHLVPTEVQTKNGKNVWESIARVGDKDVISIQIDQSKNIIWKLKDGQGYAILHAGNIRVHFTDKEESGRIIRQYDGSGGKVVIEVRDGKEVVVSTFPPGSSTEVAIKPDENIDPLTGGKITKEVIPIPAGAGIGTGVQRNWKVTTLPGGVIVKEELENDGTTVRKNGPTVIIEQGPNGSTRTRTTTTRDDGSSSTEIVVCEQGNETRMVCERNNDGAIKSLSCRRQSPNGPVTEQQVFFDYKDGELIQITVTDGDSTQNRVFVRTAQGKWNGFIGDPPRELLGPGDKPMKDCDLNPQLNQETGAFTMNLSGFEAASQPTDRSMMPRGDVPAGPADGGAVSSESDYVTLQRCRPMLLGFDQRTGLPIWAFSGHPRYTPGFAGTPWQFNNETFERRIVVGDQGKSMAVSRRVDPANPGKFIQETEFPDCPNGVVWRNRDGSAITGIRKVVTQWDKEKGCYVTTLYRQPGEPVSMYVTDEGLLYDPVKRQKMEDGLDTPRVRSGASDARGFDVRQEELRGRIGPLVADYDTAPSGDPAKKMQARDAAKDAIADYRRAIYQEIERIRQEVYGQNNGQPFDANQRAAEFRQKLEARGLSAELRRLDELEARLR